MSPPWPPPSQFLQLGDQSVHYLDIGTGPTILFVEAGMWSFIWHDVIDRLRSSFRCVTLDFPGAGRSGPTTPDRIRLTTYADVLGGLADHLGLTDITLVVHDLGGPVGLLFAAARPREIRAIVACQTFAWPPQPAALRFMLTLMGSAPVRAINAATNLVARLTAGSYGVGRHLSAADRRTFLAAYADRDKRRTFHHLMRDATRGHATFAAVEAALRGPLADKPLVTIFGDRNDPFAFQRRWKELYPHAVQHLVPGGHHFPMNDAPDTFASAVSQAARSSS